MITLTFDFLSAQVHCKWHCMNTIKMMMMMMRKFVEYVLNSPQTVPPVCPSQTGGT